MKNILINITIAFRQNDNIQHTISSGGGVHKNRYLG